MAQVKIEVGAIRFAVNGGAEVIAQEREAFAPEKRAVGEQRPAERASVIKDLAARKAEAATRGPQDKERKPPSAGMER